LELIITCSIKYSSFGTLHIGPKQCKHVLDFFKSPSWNILEICSVKSVDTLIIDDNFDCTQSISVSELFCDSNVLTPLSVANKSNEYFSHVRPNFV